MVRLCAVLPWRQIRSRRGFELLDRCCVQTAKGREGIVNFYRKRDDKRVI